MMTTLKAFGRMPPRFEESITHILGNIGTAAEALNESVEKLYGVWKETVSLTEGRYHCREQSKAPSRARGRTAPEVCYRDTLSGYLDHREVGQVRLTESP